MGGRGGAEYQVSEDGGRDGKAERVMEEEGMSDGEKVEGRADNTGDLEGKKEKMEGVEEKGDRRKTGARRGEKQREKEWTKDGRRGRCGEINEGEKEGHGEGDMIERIWRVVKRKER